MTARGNRRQLLFRDHADYQAYVRTMGRLLREMSMTCYAFVLMPNHVHLILQDPNMVLAHCIHGLHGWFARYGNDKYEQIGHVFQDRYYSALCTSEEQLLAWIRYAHLNAPRAGLTQDPVAYPWSSLKLYLQHKASPLIARDRILDQFGRQGRGDHQKHFLEFTLAGLSGLEQQIADVLLDMQAGIIQDAQRALLKLVPVVKEKLAIPRELNILTRQHGTATRQRVRVIAWLYRTGLFSLNDLALFFHVAKETVRRQSE